MAVKASAKQLSVSTKRIRPMLDLIRGKRVDEALATLQFLPSPRAKAVAKVVKSATANAENNLMMDPRSLRVVGVYADQGTPLKRFAPRARGRTGRISKRFCHITVVVDEEATSGA